jgi:hypothetical protein
MDHQDWPGWPEDDPHAGDAGTADLGGHDALGHDGLGHDIPGDDPLAHGPLGHDGLGDDPFAAPGDGGHDPAADPGQHPAPGGYGDEGDAGTGHGHFGAAGDVYPEDDPFTASHHDDSVVHDDPAPADAAHDPVHDEVAPVDHPVGADPDLDPHADADWHDPSFPPALDPHHTPEPVDGFPWSDPHVLGSGLADGALDDGGYHEPTWQHPPVSDLYDYAGDEAAPGGDGWQALLGSDDPATSSLARWWTPGG